MKTKYEEALKRLQEDYGRIAILMATTPSIENPAYTYGQIAINAWVNQKENLKLYESSVVWGVARFMTGQSYTLHLNEEVEEFFDFLCERFGLPPLTLLEKATLESGFTQGKMLASDDPILLIYHDPTSVAAILEKRMKKIFGVSKDGQEVEEN